MGSIDSTMGQLTVGDNLGILKRYKTGILNRCKKVHFDETVKLNPRKRNTEGTDILKAEATSGVERALGSTGTTLGQCYVGGKVGISKSCKKTQSAEPVKFSPHRTDIKGSAISKVECTYITKTYNKRDEPVNLGQRKRNIKGTDNSKAEATSGVERALGSTRTTLGQCNVGGKVGVSKSCKKTQSAEPVNFSPRRTDIKGPAISKVEATYIPKTCNKRNEPVKLGQRKRNSKGTDYSKAERALGSTRTTLGQCNVGGKVGISKSCKKTQSAEPVKFSPRRTDIKGPAIPKVEATYIPKTCNKRNEPVKLGQRNRNIKGTDYSKAERALGSTRTTLGQCYVGAKVGISKSCKKTQSAEPVKFSPRRTDIKGPAISKVEATYLPKTRNKRDKPVQLGMCHINKIRSDNLKADAYLETEPSFGSISTTMAQCNESDDRYVRRKLPRPSFGSISTTMAQCNEI